MIGVWSSIGIEIYREINDKEFIRLFHEVKKLFKRPGKQPSIIQQERAAKEDIEEWEYNFYRFVLFQFLS